MDYSIIEYNDDRYITDYQRTDAVDNTSDLAKSVSESTDIYSTGNTTQPTTQSSESKISFRNSNISNYDKSSKTNDTTTSIENRMINTCNAKFEDVINAINIAKSESINNNNINQNLITKDGDEEKLLLLRMESDLKENLSNNVDVNCMINELRNLVYELDADTNTILNGDKVGSESGGNNTKVDENNLNDNYLHSSMTDEYAYTQTNQTINIDNEVNVNQNIITQNNVTVIKKKKKTGGGLSDKILIFIVIILLLYYLLKSYIIGNF